MNSRYYNQKESIYAEIRYAIKKALKYEPEEFCPEYFFKEYDLIVSEFLCILYNKDEDAFNRIFDRIIYWKGINFKKCIAKYNKRFVKYRNSRYTIKIYSFIIAVDLIIAKKKIIDHISTQYTKYKLEKITIEELANKYK